MANTYQYYLEKCVANDNFRQDWQSYSLSDFTDTFLPNVPKRKNKDWTFHDGLELFSNVKTKTIGPGLNICTLSFPQDGPAFQQRNLISNRDSDVLIIASTSDNINITLEIKLNQSAAKKLNVKSSTPTTVTIQQTREELEKLADADYNRLLFESLEINYTAHRTQQFDKIMQKSIDEYFEHMEALAPTFDAGFLGGKKNNMWSHGDIEKEALFNVFKKSQIDHIYFGNWLRDYSSCIAATTVGFNYQDRKTLEKSEYTKTKWVKENQWRFGTFPSQVTWAKIIFNLAAKFFDYNGKKGEDHRHNFKKFQKHYGGITPDILGIYRPEEHIDNPKGLNDESILGNTTQRPPLNNPIKFEYEYPKGTFNSRQLSKGPNTFTLAVDENKKLKNYIINGGSGENYRKSSKKYIFEQLELARDYKRTKKGFMHLGAALHVLEDYFAHSNFTEVSLIKNGFTKVYPWVELKPAVRNITDGKKRAEKIPIVTGNFGPLDMVASVAPKIAKEFFPREIQAYKRLKFGERTIGDNLISLFLNDYIEKDYGNPTPGTVAGFTYSEINKAYEVLLKARDYWCAAVEYIPGLIYLDELLHYVVEYIMIIPRTIISLFIENTSLAIKEYQSLSYGYGDNPSHTQLAKDSDHSPLHTLAAVLAKKIVYSIGEKMDRIWKNDYSLEELFHYIETRVLIHPSTVDWMDEEVKKWAKQHPLKLIEAQSKSTVHGHINAASEYMSDYKKQLKKFIEDSEKFRSLLPEASF